MRFKILIMKKCFVLSLLSILILSSCGDGVDRKPIELNPKKYSNSKHLGNGVWLLVPKGFHEARSYDGFQSGWSSISLQIENVPLWKAKQAFDPKILKARRTKLLEMHPVKFGEIDSAFFAVVHDMRKKTVRYLLSVNDGQRTYNIKAFCMQGNEEKWDKALKESLLSTYIGTYKTEEPLFKLASFREENEMIFTKDGVFPTQSEEESVIRIQMMPKENAFLTSKDLHNFVKNKLKKLSGNTKNKITTEYLSNGTFTKGVSIGEHENAYIAILQLKEGETFIYTATGNKKQDIQEFEDYIKTNFMEYKIMPR